MSGFGGERSDRFRDLAIGKPTLGAAWPRSTHQSFASAGGAVLRHSLGDAKLESFASRMSGISSLASA